MNKNQELERALGFRPAMDIYAEPGTKILYPNREDVVESERKFATRHLKPGSIYTIKKIDRGNWSTAVYLEEVPGISFNSVLFVDLEHADVIPFPGSDKNQ